MKQLFARENIGGRIRRWFRTSGIDGDGLLVETEQDVGGLMDRSRREANEAPRRGSTFRKVAEIPVTLVEEEARKLAERTGESLSAMYREIMIGKTDRARQVWRHLLNARELRYFRTSPGRV